MNHSMGSSGIVHTLLVFRALPSLPVSTADYPIQKEKMKSLQTVSAEMASLVANSRIAQALSSKIPPVTCFPIKLGDSVQVYRERSGQWEGPFLVQRVSGQQAWLTDPMGKVRQFSLHQLHPVPSCNGNRDRMNTLQPLSPT